MRAPGLLALPFLVLSCSSSSGTTQQPVTDGTPTTNPTVTATSIFAHAEKDQIIECTTKLCRHNENTDLIRFGDAIYMIHRTAVGQVLGPNSSLRIFRSTDEGKTFSEPVIIPAPQAPLSADDTAAKGRDIRDPSFYVVGDKLHLKTLARMPVSLPRDTGVDTRTLDMESSDGVTWTPYRQIGPNGWSFWRVKEYKGTYYAAAYQDGDASVALFTSTDAVTWTMGTTFYSDSNMADTPLEPEIVFMPSGKMMIYARNDGTDLEILGTAALKTRICWADAPYTTFDCSQVIMGQRLDGPVDFWMGKRLFVVARKHLGADGRKRTALFEFTGNFDGGPLQVVEHAEFPSAGDTAYAGVVPLKNGHLLTTWYASDVESDLTWAVAMALGTDIWRGEIQF